MRHTPTKRVCDKIVQLNHKDTSSLTLIVNIDKVADKKLNIRGIGIDRSRRCRQTDVWNVYNDNQKCTWGPFVDITTGF